MKRIIIFWCLQLAAKKESNNKSWLMKKKKKFGELVSDWSFVSCLLTELFVTRVLTAHDCMQLCTLNQWHNIFNFIYPKLVLS